MLISKYGNGSTELVSEFERRLGIVLDEEYRTFLVRYNGGNTPETHVGIRGCSTNLRYLFGINTEKSIEDYLQIPVWENNRYLPIGEDYFGNYFVIGLSGDNKGKIFFCDHEKGFAVKRIADSFKQFLSKCKSEEIHPVARMSPEDREASLIANGRGSVITDGLREIWKKEYEKYKDMNQEKVSLEENDMGLFSGFKKKVEQKETVDYELDTPGTRELYKQIADKISDMIPDQWSDVYFYGEVLDDFTTAFFFYRQAQNGALLYCHDIPNVYKVGKDSYDTMLQELFNIIRELRDEAKNSGRSVWTNFTMTLDSTGKFNIKYNYDDVLDGRFSISDRHKIWQYEVLGRIPVEDKKREKLQEYLGDKVRLPEKNKFAGQKINTAKCPVCGKAGLSKRSNTLYRCEQCMTRVYTDLHDVVMYIYDQELHDALYRSLQLSAKGDYSNALKELTPYENKAWDNLGFVYQLGLAYRRAGYEDMAANWFFKCKCIKLDYVMAYHSIGLINFQRRKFRNALSEYDYSVKFLEADPDAYTIEERRTFYALYGGSLAGCGRKEEGEAMIRKAEEMGYGNGKTIRQIAGLPV